MNISIHALREEGDAIGASARPKRQNFYPRPPRGGRPRKQQRAGPHGRFLSTPSARRATYYNGRKVIPITISIHALREEGDVAEMVPQVPGQIFLSTPSARRAT